MSRLVAKEKPPAPPSCPESLDSSTAKRSLPCALVCASVVAAYDRSWLARPVSALIPDGGPRPDRLSRLKARVLVPLEARVARATRRGRPPRAAAALEAARAPLDGALLAVATSLLAESDRPLRRHAVKERLVAAHDRLHDEHGVTVRDFCAALALPERTFRAWRKRPPVPPPPAAPSPAAPPPPRSRDRTTGRFALEATAPGVRLGADTADLSVLGVRLKLVGVQDLGAREQRLWESFGLSERETARLVGEAVAAAAAGREGLQVVTDQGTSYLAQAARDAYDALAAEHAPQKEGAPTEKATVERAFATVKQALAPLLALTDRLATAVPTLRRPDLARAVGTLLVAVFLRVAGRRHLAHPLEGRDPDVLRAIVEEQREHARAEDRSVRLFLEAVHAEYAMPGSREAFVRASRRYPLDDLREAERRFRAYACRCVVKVCDRYFAACVRDAHPRGQARRSAARTARRAAAEQRHLLRAATARAADLDAHPERRLFEGLDLLVETWRPAEGRFAADGVLARIWLRRAAALLHQRHPRTAHDELERHFRAWLAGRPALPQPVRDAVRGVFLPVITEATAPQSAAHPAAAVGAILPSSARAAPDDQRPPRPPHLRIRRQEVRDHDNYRAFLGSR